MQAYLPGVTQYRCCPHNYGQGWPYLAEEMWLATPGGGLCAAIYGPSTVTKTWSTTKAARAHNTSWNRLMTNPTRVLVMS
jgi:hypothetical protein